DFAADLDEAVAATAPRRFVQLDVKAQDRMVTGHGFDGARQQAGAEGGEGGDAHAGPADGVEAVDEFIEFGHGGEDLPGVLGQALAELGDLDAAPGPVVQGCADALLQGGDVLTDRRRRVVEVLRGRDHRSEEHTSELQSRFDLVCRLLLEKKNIYDRRDKQAPCYNCLFPEGHDAVEHRCATTGVVGPPVSNIGSMQAAEEIT